MNLERLKQVPLELVLKQLGHEPAHKQGQTLRYLSPFRNEAKASFNVCQKKNLWYDFGAGVGGSAIDLVMRLHQGVGVREATQLLTILLEGTPPPVIPKSRMPSSREPAITITQVSTLRSSLLIGYLRQRGIPPGIACRYVSEVTYTVRGRKFVAIGLRNDRGGFELRHLKFKHSTCKQITTFAGDSRRVRVFEGLFDLLTFVTRFPQCKDVLVVLNSVTNGKYATKLFQSICPEQIHVYRDNDDAGLALMHQFRQNLPRQEFIDHADDYRGCNDLNEWHCQHEGVSSC